NVEFHRVGARGQPFDEVHAVHVGDGGSLSLEGGRRRRDGDAGEGQAVRGLDDTCNGARLNSLRARGYGKRQERKRPDGKAEQSLHMWATPWTDSADSDRVYARAGGAKRSRFSNLANRRLIID